MDYLNAATEKWADKKTIIYKAHKHKFLHTFLNYPRTIFERNNLRYDTFCDCLTKIMDSSFFHALNQPLVDRPVSLQRITSSFNDVVHVYHAFILFHMMDCEIRFSCGVFVSCRNHLKAIIALSIPYITVLDINFCTIWEGVQEGSVLPLPWKSWRDSSTCTIASEQRNFYLVETPRPKIHLPSIKIRKRRILWRYYCTGNQDL